MVTWKKIRCTFDESTHIQKYDTVTMIVMKFYLEPYDDSYIAEDFKRLLLLVMFCSFSFLIFCIFYIELIYEDHFLFTFS